MLIIRESHEYKHQQSPQMSINNSKRQHNVHAPSPKRRRGFAFLMMYPVNAHNHPVTKTPASFQTMEDLGRPNLRSVNLLDRLTLSRFSSRPGTTPKNHTVSSRG